jgi:hypothetical protein
MPQYEVGTARFYPTLGRWAYPGEVIPLEQDYAEELMKNEAGLLKPVRQTTQASPQAARGRKPRKPPNICYYFSITSPFS